MHTDARTTLHDMLHDRQGLHGCHAGCRRQAMPGQPKCTLDEAEVRWQVWLCIAPGQLRQPG